MPNPGDFRVRFDSVYWLVETFSAATQGWIVLSFWSDEWKAKLDMAAFQSEQPAARLL